jgi:phosphorylated CTD-interacting factor 1
MACLLKSQFVLTYPLPCRLTRLIDSKLEERDHHVSFSDPVLSGSVTLESDSSQRLVEEIRETGTSRADAKTIVQDLCRRTNTAVNEIAQQQTLHAGRAPLKKGDRIDLEGHEPVYTLVYHRKRWKKPFCIKLNSSHYDKLRAMFTRVHGETLRFSSGKPTKLTHAFHLLLMVLLLRYSALSGGQLLLDLRGGGMQGAVHGQVFGVLREIFPNGPLLECFASPLNSYLPSFGSAFPKDLDWHFGSIGNFLDEKITEGCCEANPPFSPGMMSAMAARIEYNLTQADERKGMLTFVVIVPSAGDDKVSQRAAAKRFGGISLQKMTTSSSCRLHILLSAKEHGYVEGAQHMRPTRYKESLYDTSVIVLQSEQARRHALDKGLLDEKIREAFVSRHREEVERRKQSEGEGESDASESS